jgi:hypothetical protein
LRQVLRDGRGWLIGLVITTAVAVPIASGVQYAWRRIDELLGLPLAVLVASLAFAIVSLLAAVVVGRLRLPGRAALYRVRYGLSMSAVGLREAVRAGAPGNGRRSSLYASQHQFEAEDVRRSGPVQIDFGVRWRDRERRGCRVTWIEKTGELIAIGGEADEVEVLAVIRDEPTVELRLRDWAYASLGGGSLAWVRRRARGWEVPLPPRGRWWLEHDRRAPDAWPAPPPPSVGRTAGTYIGRVEDLDPSVETVDALGHRPLYHYVDRSPTGFAWGYSGAGPSDLARSLLADRLGYVPGELICSAFREDVVERLRDDFALTFEDVDTWIDEHGSLFADDPRAQPFDPYAAGGA